MASAAKLFLDEGYHAVGVEQIGAAVGITGSAVYRHFSDKEAVFLAVVEQAVDRVYQAVSRAATEADAPADVLDRMVDVAVAATGDERDICALYLREAVYLPKEGRRGIRDRQRELIRLWADRLAAERPDLSTDQAVFLVRAAIGVIVGQVLSGGPLGQRRTQTLVAGMCRALLHAPPPGNLAEVTAPDAGGRAGDGDGASGGFAARTSRREQLLAASARLFRHRGYHSVGVDDIGAAVGISGPAVYRHFRNKHAVLVTAFRRTSETISAAAHTAVSAARSGSDALDGLIRSYVDVALANQDLIVVYTREARTLSDEDRREMRSIQAEYVRQWVHVLTSARPGLRDADARTGAFSALGFVNNVVAGGGGVAPERLRDWLIDATRIAIDSLDAPGTP